VEHESPGTAVTMEDLDRAGWLKGQEHRKTSTDRNFCMENLFAILFTYGLVDRSRIMAGTGQNWRTCRFSGLV
jgi:hypothetical protein